MSEASEARRDGTKLQPNSGRGRYKKGDGIRPLFLVDYKEASKSFTLNEAVWAKVCTDAYKVDKDLAPQLRVIFEGRVRLSIVETSMLDMLESENQRLEARVKELEGD